MKEQADACCRLKPESTSKQMPQKPAHDHTHPTSRKSTEPPSKKVKMSDTPSSQTHSPIRKQSDSPARKLASSPTLRNPDPPPRIQSANAASNQKPLTCQLEDSGMQQGSLFTLPANLDPPEDEQECVRKGPLEVQRERKRRRQASQSPLTPPRRPTVDTNIKRLSESHRTRHHSSSASSCVPEMPHTDSSSKDPSSSLLEGRW